MELLVTADDRTGALETAATLADRLGEPVPVTSWPSVPTQSVGVIDLGSRHLSPVEARTRVRDIPGTVRSAHKIDSTLRGNWPEEISTIAERRPVLLVPALPELGRTCVAGVVLEHGRPVHHGGAGTDVRRRITTSRPADALAAAGEHDVTELADAAAVGAWLETPSGVGVADASDDDAITRIVAAWWSGPSEVVLAGTSTVIGAAADDVDRVALRLEIDGPILVVCGSVHPAARAQIEAAERDGVPVALIADDVTAQQLRQHGELVLSTEIPVGDLDEPMAVAAATALAAGVDALRQYVQLGAIVIIGGDTAAAVLGDAPVSVIGSIGAGTAWSTVDRFPEPVITRSGGFGSDRALIDLLRTTLRP